MFDVFSQMLFCWVHVIEVLYRLPHIKADFSPHIHCVFASEIIIIENIHAVVFNLIFLDNIIQSFLVSFFKRGDIVKEIFEHVVIEPDE